MDDIKPTITVLYSCHFCGLTDIPVQVAARLPGDDLMAWMDQMGRVLSTDHFQRKPDCRPTKLSQVKIPMEGVECVGGVPVQ